MILYAVQNMYAVYVLGEPDVPTEKLHKMYMHIIYGNTVYVHLYIQDEQAVRVRSVPLLVIQFSGSLFLDAFFSFHFIYYRNSTAALQPLHP